MASRGRLSTIINTLPHLTEHESIVYALYGGSRQIAVALATFFVVEHVLISIFTIRTFPAMMYDSLCITTKAPPTVIGVGSVVLMFFATSLLS
jgi:hypothetical protein